MGSRTVLLLLTLALTGSLPRPTVHLAAQSALVPPEPRACLVEGPTLTEQDRELAAGACLVARSRFDELWGEPLPHVRIVVGSVRGYRIGVAAGQAVVLWPSTAAMAESVAAARAADHVTTQWREVLPHEIAHALLAARFHPDSRFPPSGYGTPLPDWLEEGSAIWAEPRASRQRRLTDARSLPPARRDLRAILAASHPAATAPALLGMRDGGAPPADDALYDFYSQSLAVVTFLHELGGREAFRELGRRLATGGAVADDTATEPGVTSVGMPLTALTGLPGLPGTVAALEAAWEEWLRR